MLAMAMVALIAQAAQTPPVHQRYRLEVTTQNELDQTSIGKGKLASGLTTNAIISVVMTDSAAGKVVRITVDSIGLVPTGSLVADLNQRPNAVRDARGVVVQVYVVRGQIVGRPQSSDTTNNPALVGVAQAIGVLFPGIRAGVKVGDAWADTTHINNGSGTMRQTGEIVANWKVTGVDVGGAVVLDGRSVTHTKIDDSSNGQTMTLSGVSTENVVIPPSGLIRRAVIETSTDRSVTAPQLTTPIPGKNTGMLKLTPLP